VPDAELAVLAAGRLGYCGQARGSPIAVDAVEDVA
jgi:hypothetical protein